VGGIVLAIAAVVFFVVYPKFGKVANSAISGVQIDYADEKLQWIQADLSVLRSLCPGLNANNRTLFLKDRAFDRVAALDQRRKACSSLDSLEQAARGAQSTVKSASELAPYGAAQDTLTSTLVALDSALSSMPTPLLQGSNPTPEQMQTLDSARSAGIARVRSLAERTVDVARTASEQAAGAAATSNHTTDKTFAQESDAAYSQAKSQLEAAAGQTGSALFTNVDKVFSASLSAIDYAQQSMGQGPSLAAAHAPITAAPYVPPTPNVTKRPSAPAQPTTRGIDPAEAAAYVTLYYQLWNDHRFSEMYSMLSPSYRNDHAYNAWYNDKVAQGTVHISAQTSPGSDPGAVDLTIDSVDAPSGSAAQSSRYAGTWWLVRVNGHLYLDHNRLEPVQ
jgi:hypothetical protein